jgi:hypothetical protein
MTGGGQIVFGFQVLSDVVHAVTKLWSNCFRQKVNRWAMRSPVTISNPKLHWLFQTSIKILRPAECRETFEWRLTLHPRVDFAAGNRDGAKHCHKMSLSLYLQCVYLSIVHGWLICSSQSLLHSCAAGDVSVRVLPAHLEPNEVNGQLERRPRLPAQRTWLEARQAAPWWSKRPSWRENGLQIGIL